MTSLYNSTSIDWSTFGRLGDRERRSTRGALGRTLSTREPTLPGTAFVMRAAYGFILRRLTLRTRYQVVIVL